eukprot:TRINITY_DN6067_c0_g1_i4.p1 TRINITY_DN6067_c0_g1~~TRINITY_DN6067_c0_g1_i4.p1  ORF type:complete len:364 (-),score=77.00 TRINITY_DN6067_c0_g1_i4:35-1066(-)
MCIRDSLETRQNLIIRQPIKFGYLNVSPTYPMEEVLRDIENLTTYILEKRMGISRRQLDEYYVILILPDLFNREHAKALIGMFLRSLGFKAITMHLESVLACYGSALTHACVVDVGHEKISVACVEEGVIVPGTLVRKHFGGADMTTTLHRLLSKRFAYNYSSKAARLDFERIGDQHIVERLKEVACFSIQSDDNANRIYELVNLEKAPTEKISVSNNESFYIAPNIIYCSDILNAFGRRPLVSNKHVNCVSNQFEGYVDPEDHLEELTYSLIPGSGILQLAPGPSEMAAELGAQRLSMTEDARRSAEELTNPFWMINLHEMVSLSISTVSYTHLTLPTIYSV